MNQKHIGAIILLAGILILTFSYAVKLKEDRIISEFVGETGSCYLEDGSCLHEDRDLTIYLVGGAIAIALIFFGIYLSFFDKTQELLIEHQQKVSTALKEAKRQEKERDEFKAFLSGFNEEEKKVLKAIREQEGVTQSTLRFRTDLSKTKLSLLLKSFEEKGIIKRKEKGKSKEVHLVKRF